MPEVEGWPSKLSFRSHKQGYIELTLSSGRVGKAVVITRHRVVSRLLRNALLRGQLSNGDEKHIQRG